MRITPYIFDAFLKCATKCHLRSLGEIGSGNEYAEWVRGQDESYQREAVRRLQEAVPETERVVGSRATENLKAAQWQLAVDIVAQTPDRGADSHPRELVNRDGRGPASPGARSGSAGDRSVAAGHHPGIRLADGAGTAAANGILCDNNLLARI